MSLNQEAINRLRKDLQLVPSIKYARVSKLFKEMAKTDQTSEYHQEGDVLTHTHMVVKALEQVLEEQDGYISYENNPLHRILLFSAWFHDVGKIETKEWNEKKGRSTFNSHNDASIRIWREIALDCEVDVLFAEHVAELIRSHSIPLDYSKMKASEAAYRRLADRVCPKNLCTLSRADMIGRISSCGDKLLALIDQFEQKCLDYDVLEIDRFRDYRVYSLSEFAYLTKNKKCLLLPVGVPGCGRSHLRNELVSFYPDTKVISPDEIRTELYGEDWQNNYDLVDNQKVFGIANGRLKQAMSSGSAHMIFFDATNSSIKDRKVKIDMATKYHYAVVCFWFRTKLETILKQNKERDRNTPEEYIKKNLGFLQLPTKFEADYVVCLTPR